MSETAATSPVKLRPADPEPTEPPVPPAPSGSLALVGVGRAYRTGSGPLVVLGGADLNVVAGEMVALVAPSGAGKSTLLHVAGLLEQPDAGEVFIGGQPTTGMGDAGRTALRRTEIGFVYQFHHLLPEFSALENLMLPQMIAGLDRKEAESRGRELLAYLRVDHRATHRPAELSGGEQQRVAIARAVANAPRVLLADEPTGNLDPKTAEHVFDALRTLVRESGLAALIATHNYALAAGMDRTITIKDGVIAPADLGQRSAWEVRFFLARSIQDLPNLGPMMARRLREIGVYSEDDLRKVGPLMAFAALRARFPRDVSLIALYAMEAALVGVDWRALPPGRKAELRLSAALGHSDR